MLSGGRGWPVLVEQLDAPSPSPGGSPRSAPLVLAAEGAVPAVTAAGYRIEPCGYALRRFKAVDLWQLVTGNAAEKAALHAAKREPYYLATPASSP